MSSQGAFSPPSMTLCSTSSLQWLEKTTRIGVAAQGQAKAKAEGRYRGRPEDSAKNARIARMLHAQLSWSQIQETLHCSRGTVAKVAARMRQEEAAA